MPNRCGVLEVKGDILAELCGQSILKALGRSVQSGVLHQLADANGILLAVTRCRKKPQQEEAVEEAAVELEEPPQAVRAAAAPQTAAADRERTARNFTHDITPSILLSRQQDTA